MPPPPPSEQRTLVNKVVPTRKTRRGRPPHSTGSSPVTYKYKLLLNKYWYVQQYSYIFDISKGVACTQTEHKSKHYQGTDRLPLLTRDGYLAGGCRSAAPIQTNDTHAKAFCKIANPSCSRPSPPTATPRIAGHDPASKWRGF